MRLLHHTVCVGGPFQIISDVYTEELEAFHTLHCSPVDVDRGVLPLLSPKSMISSFILLTLRKRLFSWHHSTRALTSSLQSVTSLLVIRPITVVVCKLDNSFGGVHGQAVMGDQGVQEADEIVFSLSGSKT